MHIQHQAGIDHFQAVAQLFRQVGAVEGVGSVLEFFAVIAFILFRMSVFQFGDSIKVLQIRPILVGVAFGQFPCFAQSRVIVFREFHLLKKRHQAELLFHGLAHQLLHQEELLQ